MQLAIYEAFECMCAQTVSTSLVPLQTARTLVQRFWLGDAIYLGLVHVHTSRPEAKMC